jgi:acyl carrier protein
MSETHFTLDLGADFLDRVELMLAIEDQFAGVEITDDDVEQIQVVGDLIRHLQNTYHVQAQLFLSSSPRGRQKVGDKLDLIGTHQRRRVTTTFNLVNQRKPTATFHLSSKIGRQKIRFFAA